MDAQLDLIYMSELKVQQVSMQDLKTLIMAILRLNDGKRFADADEAPLPQSENEIGFRRAGDDENEQGRFMIRYEEIPHLQRHFEPLYTNRLQLAGVKIEQ